MFTLAIDLGVLGLPESLAVPYSLVEAAFRTLRRRVSDMSQDALDYRGPDGTFNSTATLLAHLGVVDLHYWHYIIGKPVPPELADEYGPFQDEHGKLPVVAGRSAAELLERHQRAHDLGRAFLATQDDAFAVREVNIPWWPEPATVRFVLWHMAGHAKFHEGHIARLKALYKEERQR